MLCLRNKSRSVYSVFLRVLMRVIGRIFKLKLKLFLEMNMVNKVVVGVSFCFRDIII